MEIFSRKSCHDSGIRRRGELLEEIKDRIIAIHGARKNKSGKVVK